MRVREVGVIILDQLDKIHSLRLDVPYMLLYRPTDSDFRGGRYVASYLLRAIANVPTKVLEVRFGVLVTNYRTGTTEQVAAPHVDYQADCRLVHRG